MHDLSKNEIIYYGNQLKSMDKIKLIIMFKYDYYDHGNVRQIM